MRLRGLDLRVVDGAGLSDEDIDGMWAVVKLAARRLLGSPALAASRSGVV